MQPMTILGILILLFPFILWILGIKKRIPALITLAGFMLCIIPFYFGFPLFLIIIIVLLGIMIILGSIMVVLQ